MHREFDPAVQPFARRSNFFLYIFTFFLVSLLVADLWPPLSTWLKTLRFELPSWASRELFGVRYALIAAILGGVRILVSSIENAADGKIGADLAVAITCIAAILIGEPLVAAEVVVIGLIGECLEAFTFDRTQRALRSLVELFPNRTWVLRDGHEVRVFTEQLVVGDHVVVKPGGKIPIDGTILDGRSTLDTSALTGESLPRDAGPGDSVLAGSINQLGSLTIEAKKVAKETIAGQVIELTASALAEKAPLERYADLLARRFLPAVLAIALLAFVVNILYQMGPLAGEKRPSFAVASRLALYPTLAVLVVACPCPLVLATPAAVIAALGRLAGTGVLIKGGSALERLAKVTAFAFDKTGTLTSGELTLGDLLPLGSTSVDELLRLVASAEQRSEHPLAAMLVRTARERQLVLDPVDEFQAHPGGGISATLQGKKILVGTRRLMEEHQIALTDDILNIISQLDSTGQSALLVARDGTLLGAVGARDTLRPSAAGVVAELKALGLSPLILLSGDRQAATKTIGSQLPLDEIRGELLPADKADAIASASYAFVGDGINDAPALARAQVGIAIGTGASLVAEAGDIVLMGDPLRPLPLLVKLSRQTVAIIRQNILWFGFGANILGIVITGFLWPLLATSADWFEKAPLAGVLYHQIGSLAVLLNSMRLLTFDRATSSHTLTSINESYTAVDQWLNTFHIEDLFDYLVPRWKPIGLAIVGIALLAWFASGLTQIAVNEVGVVQRFGAPRADLTPGLHLRWPWPIEQVTKLAPDQVRMVTLGFRYTSEQQAQILMQARAEQQKLRKAGQPGISDRDQTWSSAHMEEINLLSDESVMITGDSNLVDVFATVHYSLADPKTYLFGSRDVDATIRLTVESVLREVMAGQEFFELLTTNRKAIEQKAGVLLEQRLQKASDGRLGIRFLGLSLHDLHPPPEVVNAYRQVAEAIQKKDRMINDAEADAIRTKQIAEVNAMRMVRQTESDAVRKIAEATASRDAFLAYHKLRTQLSPEQEAKLAKELEQRVAAGENRDVVTRSIQEQREKLLSVRRSLLELRITLTTVAGVLAGRDKVFIDAENLPGRRQMILADPESLKIPAALNRPPQTEKEP